MITIIAASRRRCARRRLHGGRQLPRHERVGALHDHQGGVRRHVRRCHQRRLLRPGHAQGDGQGRGRHHAGRRGARDIPARGRPLHRHDQLVGPGDLRDQQGLRERRELHRHGHLGRQQPLSRQLRVEDRSRSRPRSPTSTTRARPRPRRAPPSRSAPKLSWDDGPISGRAVKFTLASGGSCTGDDERVGRGLLPARRRQLDRDLHPEGGVRRRQLLRAGEHVRLLQGHVVLGAAEASARWSSAPR